MKLYATTTSERASKGQGGNEYIHITLLDDRKNPIFFIGYFINKIVVEDLQNQKYLLVHDTKGKKKKDD